MKLHTDAWKDINILIFGKDSMRFEQLIAKSNPHLAEQLESFENYDQAYDFCKENKNTGLIFVIDDENVLLTDVINQLSSHFQSIMPVCPCVLITTDRPSFSSIRAMKECSNVIEVFKTDVFENETELDACLIELWNSYTNEMSNKIWGSEGLQDLILDNIIKSIGVEDYDFYRKLSNLIISSVNLSWMDKLKAEWSYLLKQHPDLNSILTSNPALNALIINATIPTNSDVSSVLNGQFPLVMKIEYACDYLLKSKQDENLKDVVGEISQSTKLSSNIILRTIKKNQSHILSLSTEKSIRKVA